MGLEASTWGKCEPDAAAGVDAEASAQCSGERDLTLGGDGGLNGCGGSAVAGQSKIPFALHSILLLLTRRRNSGLEKN